MTNDKPPRALAATPAVGGEPVAWRWRPRESTNWIYNPTDEWRLDNQDIIECQPLYAALPASPLRNRDAVWKAKAEAAFVLFEEIKRRKAAVEALKKFVHYETWMDHHTDDVEVSTFKRHTFGDLRNAVEIINSEPALAATVGGERCPTCNMTDAGYSVYVEGWCRDQWHADDHMRAKDAAPPASPLRIKEATAAQHFDLPKGEPARFVRNGVLETCQCSDCAALTPPASPLRGREIADRLQKIVSYQYIGEFARNAIWDAVAVLSASEQPAADPVTGREIRDVLEKCVQYVRQRHNANIGWWNDSYAWEMIENVLKPAIAKFGGPLPTAPSKEPELPAARPMGQS